MGSDLTKAKGLLAKTDKIDSMVLAEYGLRLQPKPFLDVSQKTYELQEWLLDSVVTR